MRAVAHVDRQLIHLLKARPVAVPELRAFMHGEGNDPRRAGVGADDQHLRLSVAGGELAVAAVPAQVNIAHRSAVLYIQLAHIGNRF